MLYRVLMATALVLPTAGCGAPLGGDGCDIGTLRAAANELKQWPGASSPRVFEQCDSMESPSVDFSVSDLEALERKLTDSCVQSESRMEGNLAFTCTLGGREGDLVLDTVSKEGSFYFS